MSHDNKIYQSNTQLNESDDQERLCITLQSESDNQERRSITLLSECDNLDRRGFVKKVYAILAT